jgi:hypothetical protein
VTDSVDHGLERQIAEERVLWLIALRYECRSLFGHAFESSAAPSPFRIPADA